MKVKHLKLYCANLDELRFFYTRKFRFPVIEDTPDSITLKVGDSKLTFEENRLHKSYYHFAINIPFGGVEKALRWAHKKVDILQVDDESIQEFRAWNARAFYFLDPAGNVVEFIGRKRFNDTSPASFSEANLLNISEVGIPVFEVSSAFKILKKATGIKKFDCVSNMFCAAGDHEGLFILVDSAEKSWFPTDDPARAFNLEVDFLVGDRAFNLIYLEGDLEIDDVKTAETASG
jgi:catechol 2,3-dioxygenase-like lactoylglutathione lyase family enzyme